MSNNRLIVPPTITMLAMIKARLAGATKGHALLKKKADALTIKFRQILKKIVDTKTKMGKSLKTSSFALTEAKYAAGDNVKHTIFDNVEAAQVRVKASTDNVAGVKLPKFEYVNDSTESKMDMTGLGKGGQQIQGCRQSYLKAVELLVDLASLQTSFLALDTAIKTTNRRVNALENVVKPKLENTIAYIKGELDELEREEFFRLKKVQAKKKRDMDAKEEAEKAAREKGITASSLAPAYEAPSLLETVQDDDLLF
mmetsp:Transcript_1994/g.3422  ORF Transcript_1994/g.3422 Transcript_1994/m.3422 type:complete len:255 (+) Transcript_1994:316-1080(+)|eukprot:CAMPEP_0198212688 /NCGR_PEP_ID=MMETSP1445-20131203/27207_1 /TAXON_ID=36898 /ORGANISM="Pyramimonas sp., Strain CCMP2087" /LENGTH=254 /DNA_ID=CAMNT_0043887205 /DNA_START=306 /DNA_END=1070 /DNA_ORIENTATION=-